MTVTFHADGRIDGFNESSMPAGSIIQVVNHSTTSRVNPTPSPADPITATSGVEYASFDFTPKLANSKLLLTSSTLMFGERSNVGDTMIAFATHGGDTIIGSWCNYAGYDFRGMVIVTRLLVLSIIFLILGVHHKRQYQ